MFFFILDKLKVIVHSHSSTQGSFGYNIFTTVILPAKEIPEHIFMVINWRTINYHRHFWI